MKNTFLLICLLLAILSVSCGKDDAVFKMQNPRVKSYLVEKNGMHVAFPTIVGNSDGSKLLIAYREATSHVSFDGKIIQKESYDKGQTWINRRVICDLGDQGDARDPQYTAFPDGTLVCRFFQRVSEDSSIVRVLYSTDFGGTYSMSANDFPMPHSNESFAAARGNMLLVSNELYSTAYNKWDESWLVKSTDKGHSWDFVSWIDKLEMKNSGGEHRELNESSLCMEGGIMRIVARSGREKRNLYAAHSNDMGISWENWHQLPVYGQAPSLTPYKDIHILSYRNVDTENNEGFYQFECALFGKGNLLSEPVMLFKAYDFDMGYGDVFTFDKFFLMCCYVNSGVYCLEVFYDIFE